MKMKRLVAGLAILLMTAGVPVYAATVQPYQAGAFATAQKNGDPILVFVEASWCPICAKERPILLHLYGTPEFKALQVFDVDFDMSKPLLRKLDVQMQSTLIVYRGVKETGRLTGATDPTIIKRLLETASS
jgi:thioredoxin 1